MAPGSESENPALRVETSAELRHGHAGASGAGGVGEVARRFGSMPAQEHAAQGVAAGAAARMDGARPE